MPGASESTNGYGEMPIAMYLQKIEQTCIYEDSDLMYNYNRASLKDIRPDKPMFESDQPRRENFSADYLNMRAYGSRSTAEPYLPDGTFLDFDGMARDPRGTATEPNMMAHRKQQEARGKFIKYYNDEDNSVPGEGRTPQQVIKDIKGSFYQVKDRMKIFEESMNNMHNGGASVHKITTSRECMQRTDAKHPDMRDEICNNRSSKVNDLSNNTSIGWRRTTDNRFQIARYGHIRSVRNKKNDNVNKNRSNATLDMDIPVAFRDQNVAKSLALKMIDLSKKRQNDIINGKSLHFEESQQQSGKNYKKISNADLSAMERNETDASQPMTANADINGVRSQHVTGGMVKSKLDANRMAKSDVSIDIVKQMMSVNRTMNTKKLDDLREAIKQSADMNDFLHQQNNKSANHQEIKNELLWQSKANHEKGDSYKIANYKKTIDSMIINKPQNHDSVEWEDYKKSQKISDQRRGNLITSYMSGINTTEYDNKDGLEIVHTKSIGGMGSKYMRKFMERDDDDRETLGEITAHN